MEVYIPKAVGNLRAFYGELLDRQADFPTISSHLDALSRRMFEGVQLREEIIFTEIGNYHQAHLGRPRNTLARLNFTPEDCRQAIANEYGFTNWAEAGSLGLSYDMAFEKTVDTLLGGDLKGLNAICESNPTLLNRASGYGHGATLLHYAVSNGIEMWRQQVPLNLPELVDYLLKNGANRNAKMKVYGGEYTAPELLLSSLNLRNAGIFDEMRSLMDT